MDSKPTCPNCYPFGPNIVHDGIKCWIKRNKERATFTAILKRHMEIPTPQEVTHMKGLLIRQMEGWYKKGKMEFVEVRGPYDSDLPGGHYMLKFQPKGEVRK